MHKFHLFWIGVSCPGGSVPCNGNGECDLTNGLCICNSLTTGSDCSGNIYIHFNFFNWRNLTKIDWFWHPSKLIDACKSCS